MLKNYYSDNFYSKKFYFKRNYFLFFAAVIPDIEVLIGLAAYRHSQRKFKLRELSACGTTMTRSRYWLYSRNLRKVVYFINRHFIRYKTKNMLGKRQIIKSSVRSYKKLFVLLFYIVYCYNSLSYNYKQINFDLRLNIDSKYLFYFFYNSNRKKVGINFNKINYNYLSHISTRVYFNFFIYIYNINIGMATGRSEKNFFYKLSWDDFFLFFVFLQKRKYLFIFKVTRENKYLKWSILRFFRRRRRN